MGANSGQRAALARGKQQQQGAARRAGVTALSEIASLAAAGYNISSSRV